MNNSNVEKLNNESDKIEKARNKVLKFMRKFNVGSAAYYNYIFDGNTLNYRQAVTLVDELSKFVPFKDLDQKAFVIKSLTRQVVYYNPFGQAYK